LKDFDQLPGHGPRAEEKSIMADTALANAAPLPLAIEVKSKSQVDLIRAIQAARGETPCYRSEARLLCRHTTCQWRADCRRLIAIWRR
jgi:hypothetical protein